MGTDKDEDDPWLDSTSKTISNNSSCVFSYMEIILCLLFMRAMIEIGTCRIGEYAE